MIAWPGRLRLDVVPLVPGVDKVASWLLSLFLALGPVYWLPDISMAALRKVEWSIFLAASCLVLGRVLLKRRRPFPAGLLGPLGFAGVLVLWIPGFVQASEQPFKVIEFVIKLGISSAFFWCFFCVARDAGDVRVIFQRAFVMLAALSSVVLVDTLWWTPDWQRPCLWEARNITGFSTKTTAWSVGLAVFIPMAALFFLPSGNRSPTVWKFIGVVGVVVLLGNQFISGGRTGMLSSLLVVAAFAFMRSTRRLAAIVILLGLLASIVYMDRSCATHLRLRVKSNVWNTKSTRHMQDASAALKRIDAASTRRVQGYLFGLEKIAERPLLGHGLGQVALELKAPWNRRAEIHNLWLRWASFTGILAPLLFLFMVMRILRTGWRIFRDESATVAERDESAALCLIVLSGLLMSMLETNTPVGSFQLTAIWWAAGGALVGAADRAHLLQGRGAPQPG